MVHSPAYGITQTGVVAVLDHLHLELRNELASNPLNMLLLILGESNDDFFSR